MQWKSTVPANEFMPKEDVIRTKEDGRQIVVARAGTPMTRAKAIQLGLLKAEEKQEPSKSNKAEPAKQNKTGDKT